MAEKPLAGKRIVLTRAPDQSRELSHLLEEFGAEVLSLPTVSFAPPSDWTQVDSQLRRLDSFDAILFLSRNAVRYIFDRCAELGIEWEPVRLRGRLIAAVGPGTASALRDAGMRVDYVAKLNTGESLARELQGSLSGRRVLLPRSDRGDERVPDALRKIGADVTEVIAYRTTEPGNIDSGILARVKRGEVDVVVFSSPSAFENFARLIGEAETKALSATVEFCAIGPTTAAAIRRSSGRVALEAERASSPDLAQAIAEHYCKDSTVERRA